MSSLSLGDKVKATRINKKMTQSEVSGDFITRNMLSQIENNLATPSIKTIEYLAKALNKPISFFMDDNNSEAECFECLQSPHVKNAFALYENNKFEEIQLLLEDKIQKDSLTEETTQILFHTYLKLGRIHKNNNEYKQALMYFEKAENIFKSSKFISVLTLKELEIEKYELIINIPEMINKSPFPKEDNKLDTLYQRNLVFKIEYIYANESRKNIYEKINKIEAIITLPYPSACLKYLKAKVMLTPLFEKNYSASQKDVINKTISLLNDAEKILESSEYHLYLTLIYQLKAKLYSFTKDFEQAYFYLDKVQK